MLALGFRSAHLCKWCPWPAVGPEWCRRWWMEPGRSPWEVERCVDCGWLNLENSIDFPLQVWVRNRLNRSWLLYRPYYIDPYGKVSMWSICHHLSQTGKKLREHGYKMIWAIKTNQYTIFGHSHHPKDWMLQYPLSGLFPTPQILLGGTLAKYRGNIW